MIMGVREIRTLHEGGRESVLAGGHGAYVL